MVAIGDPTAVASLLGCRLPAATAPPDDAAAPPAATSPHGIMGLTPASGPRTRAVTLQPGALRPQPGALRKAGGAAAAAEGTGPWAVNGDRMPLSCLCASGGPNDPVRVHFDAVRKPQMCKRRCGVTVGSAPLCIIVHHCGSRGVTVGSAAGHALPWVCAGRSLHAHVVAQATTLTAPCCVPAWPWCSPQVASQCVGVMRRSADDSPLARYVLACRGLHRNLPMPSCRHLLRSLCSLADRIACVDLGEPHAIAGPGHLASKLTYRRFRSAITRAQRFWSRCVAGGGRVPGVQSQCEPPLNSSGRQYMYRRYMYRTEGGYVNWPRRPKTRG